MLWLWQLDDNTHLIAEEAPAEVGQCPLVVRLGLTAVVRYWGTTKGRGQLCIEGPTDKTIADIEPEGGDINRMKLRRRTPVTAPAEAKWRAHLEAKWREYISGKKS